MMMIYLPIKFDFDRTNRFKLESRNQQLMLSNEQNAKKRMNGRKNTKKKENFKR